MNEALKLAAINPCIGLREDDPMHAQHMAIRAFSRETIPEGQFVL